MMRERSESPFDVAVRELVVAIRGRRSQKMLARKSGLAVQRIAAWERGRRKPSVSDIIGLARAAKIDVDTRFSERLPHLADVEETVAPGPARDAAYVRGLVQTVIGGQSAVAVAKRARIHRATLSSWARGTTEPRMVELLALFASAHYEAAYVTSLFVDPASIAALDAAWSEKRVLTELFEESPDAFAVTAALETNDARPASVESIASLTAMTVTRVRAVLKQLQACQLVARRGKGWVGTRAEVWLVRPTRVQRFYGFLAAEQMGRDLRARRGLHVGAIDERGMEELAVLGSGYAREVQIVFAAASERTTDRVAVVSEQLFDIGRAAPGMHPRALERSRLEGVEAIRRTQR